MRLVPTKLVLEKAILSEVLYDDSGCILVNAGAPLTSELIEKINREHIYSVYIKDQHSSSDIEPLISPKLRQNACSLVKQIFDRAGNRKPDGTHAPLPILGIMPELSKLMDDILYEMAACKDKQLEYIAVKPVNGYLHSSAVDVALLSVHVGWELGLSNEMIYQLFLGAIFHDIGMALLPKEIVYKKEALTAEDKRLILSHPLIGHEYLKDKSFLSSYVRAVVLGHHEHADGTGYPEGRKGEELHILTQIVGIADIFDAMTSDRPYRQALPSHEALEYIMSVADSHFSVDVVKAFVNKINPMKFQPNNYK
jgi:HD-GYP domain-containing protein (c-di-GMP phosphodiesterase class II)